MAGLRTLCQRCRLIAIDGRGRGKHKFLAVKLLHDLQNAERRVKIISVVSQRQANRFTDGLQTGKMDHRRDRLFGENITQGLLVADINIIKRRAFAGDFLDPLQNARRTV